jgi:hypothetical protein
LDRAGGFTQVLRTLPDIIEAAEVRPPFRRGFRLLNLGDLSLQEPNHQAPRIEESSRDQLPIHLAGHTIAVTTRITSAKVGQIVSDTAKTGLETLGITDKVPQRSLERLSLTRAIGRTRAPSSIKTTELADESLRVEGPRSELVERRSPLMTIRGVGG